MKLEMYSENGRLNIAMIGELDHHAARKAVTDIENKIEATLPRDCVLNLENLSFMDSSGIAVLLKTYKRMNALGGRMWVENVPSQPMRVLDAAGIDRMIRISALS